MTNTTPESVSQSIPHSVQCAAEYLRGELFFIAVPKPAGLCLTGRRTLAGLSACMSEEEVDRAFPFNGPDRRSVTDRLRDAAMRALVQSREDAPSTESHHMYVEVDRVTERAYFSLDVLAAAVGLDKPKPQLQSFADALLGQSDFRAQVQGSGLALYATGSSRTAYLTEMVANAAMARGGIDELTRQARGALGLDASVPSDRKAPIAHVTVEATFDTSQPLAAVKELSAAVTHLEEKLDSTAGQLGVLLSVIPAVSGAVSAICPEGGTGADHQAAAAHLVALVEKVRKLALGAE
ncbi:hypothetical protein JKA73_10890 [Myxococcus xanthus]|uniref:hypothetical protein n=1 Tax=Myxococcus xanthus TaxID=34 RepID=UPI00191714B3|nr:hypothetical protein [Myxococcus xanthus]QQR46534.1 hypothetical protein JKA73_10890 [Myxococcus xanthus]